MGSDTGTVDPQSLQGVGARATGKPSRPETLYVPKGTVVDIYIYIYIYIYPKGGILMYSDILLNLCFPCFLRKSTRLM